MLISLASATGILHLKRELEISSSLSHWKHYFC